MFACANYRLTRDFEDNILAELKDNIRRLRHHASLGLWCGNNEIESAWEGWGLPEDPEARQDYLTLFESIIPGILSELDPETFYWPSSPSSGGGFRNSSSNQAGDMHYWAVWHSFKPIEAFREFYYRFCSEYGFESLPDIKTFRAFAGEESTEAGIEVPTASGAIRPEYRALDYVQIEDEQYKELKVSIFPPLDDSEEAQTAYRTALDTTIMTQLFNLYPVKTYPRDLLSYVTGSLKATYIQYADLYGMDLPTFLKQKLRSVEGDIIEVFDAWYADDTLYQWQQSVLDCLLREGVSLERTVRSAPEEKILTTDGKPLGDSPFEL
jgi:hypothetical protein